VRGSVLSSGGSVADLTGDAGVAQEIKLPTLHRIEISNPKSFWPDFN